ncbi:hypothetical protein YB2330_000899 [Saitoella coloradoensis]
MPKAAKKKHSRSAGAEGKDKERRKEKAEAAISLKKTAYIPKANLDPELNALLSTLSDHLLPLPNALATRVNADLDRRLDVHLGKLNTIRSSDEDVNKTSKAETIALEKASKIDTSGLEAAIEEFTSTMQTLTRHRAALKAKIAESLECDATAADNLAAFKEEVTAIVEEAQKCGKSAAEKMRVGMKSCDEADKGARRKLVGMTF